MTSFSCSLKYLCLLLIILVTENTINAQQTSGALVRSRLISTVRGEIDADNYAHYQIHERGDIKLVLVTLDGDADM